MKNKEAKTRVYTVNVKDSVDEIVTKFKETLGAKKEANQPGGSKVKLATITIEEHSEEELKDSIKKIVDGIKEAVENGVVAIGEEKGSAPKYSKKYDDYSLNTEKLVEELLTFVEEETNGSDISIDVEAVIAEIIEDIEIERDYAKGVIRKERNYVARIKKERPDIEPTEF